jgi:hypothetical protein
LTGAWQWNDRDIYQKRDIDGIGHERGLRLVSFRIQYVAVICLAVCSFVNGQVAYRYPEQELRVHDLPGLTARSSRSSDVLATALEIIFNDKDKTPGHQTLQDRERA